MTQSVQQNSSENKAHQQFPPSSKIGVVFTTGLLVMALDKNQTVLIYKNKLINTLSYKYQASPSFHAVFHKNDHYMLFIKQKESFKLCSAELRILNKETFRFKHVMDVKYIGDCAGILSDEQYLYVLNSNQKIVQIDVNLRYVKELPDKRIQTLQWFCGYSHIGTPGVCAKVLQNGVAVETTEYKYSCMYRMPGIAELNQHKHYLKQDLPIVQLEEQEHSELIYSSAGYCVNEEAIVNILEETVLNWQKEANPELFAFNSVHNSESFSDLTLENKLITFINDLMELKQPDNVIQAQVLLYWFARSGLISDSRLKTQVQQFVGHLYYKLEEFEPICHVQ